MFKKILFTILIITALTLSIFPQAANQDKYSTVNLILKKVYFTNIGLIIEYMSANELRKAYLPHKFFNEGIAVKVTDEDSKTTPQLNIIYKNSEQYKVKLYMPSMPSGESYPLITHLPQDMVDEFKKTDKLNIVLFNEATGQVK